MRIIHRRSKWSNLYRLTQGIGCLVLWLSINSGAAQATLVQVNDPIFGSSSLVLDTNTGLEWLNLTNTQGLSANQVISQLGPAGRFTGFQYADRNEFVTLFTEVFGRSGLVHLEDDLDLSATENFAELFGPTGSVSIDGIVLPTIAGGLFALDTSGGGSVTFIGFSYGPNLSGGLGGGSDTDSLSLDYRNFGVGSFLVRAVPEPPIAPLSVSLLGLAAVMLRRKQKTA